MNILLINHYAGSPIYGMEYRPFYMAKEWSKENHKTTIIAASFSHVRTRQPQMRDWQQEEWIEGIRYIWLKTPAYEGNGVRRVINMFVFLWRLFLWWMLHAKQEKFDAVIASSTYPLDMFPARWIARKTQAKLIFEVHDLWPLSPMELGGMSKWHPFILLMQWGEDFSYKHADAVVSMLPMAKAHMEKRGLREGKFHYIPNGISLDEWKSTSVLPAEIAGQIKRLKDKGAFLVAYTGAHGIANALDALLDAAKMGTDKDIKILLVGNGPEKERLQRRLVSEKLDNVIFVPSVEKKCIPELLRQMDVLYIGLQRQKLFRFGISPNKLMDYMMSAKPVIQAIDAGNDIVSEAECGISIQPEDPEALVQALAVLKNLSPAQRKMYGDNGKRYVEDNHSYEKLAKKFLTICGYAEKQEMEGCKNDG